MSRRIFVVKCPSCGSIFMMRQSSRHCFPQLDILGNKNYQCPVCYDRYYLYGSYVLTSYEVPLFLLPTEVSEYPEDVEILSIGDKIKAIDKENWKKSCLYYPNNFRKRIRALERTDIQLGWCNGDKCPVKCPRMARYDRIHKND